MNDTNTSTGGPGRAEAVASYEMFLATIRDDPDRSEATQYSYGKALKHLLAVAPVPPGELNNDHIAAFRARLDNTIAQRSGKPIVATTVNLSLSGLRAYLRWAQRGDLLVHPSLKGRRDRRDSKRMRRDRTLTSEEDVALMTGCHRVASTSENPIEVRNHAFVLFLLTTGLRISEALGLRWRDLDLEMRTVHVRRGKGGKERTALMDSRAAQVMGRLHYLGQMRPLSAVDHIPGIEAWGDDTHKAFGEDDPVFCGSRPLEQMPKCNANKVAKKISKRYTGKDYTAHCFRHTFCTRFLRHGKTLQDLQTLMELAGHSSMDTTQGYLDLDERIRDERFGRVIEAHWSSAEMDEPGTGEHRDPAPPEEMVAPLDDEPSEDGCAVVDRPSTLFDWA